MKKLMLITTSIVLAASASAALAQGGDACSKKYGACMDRCGSRPSSVQASCSQTCEANTNDCYVEIYGRPPAAGQGQAAASQPAQPARDAQGKAEPAAPAEPAAAPEQK